MLKNDDEYGRAYKLTLDGYGPFELREDISVALFGETTRMRESDDDDTAARKYGRVCKARCRRTRSRRDMDESTIQQALQNAIQTMIEISSLDDVRTYKVFAPRPILYCFNASGLVCFVWADEYDRKYGRYQSNNFPDVIKCSALIYDDRLRERAKPVHPFRDNARRADLSINKQGLWEILRYYAATKPDNSFSSDDLRLFFEKPSNALNDADQWMTDFAGELVQRCPEKRISRN